MVKRHAGWDTAGASIPLHDDNVHWSSQLHCPTSSGHHFHSVIHCQGHESMQQQQQKEERKKKEE